MNEEIRETLKATRLKQWEIAAELNVSESTLIRWLRRELSQEKKAAILDAIRKVQERGLSA